jgi:hypothetical protein
MSVKVYMIVDKNNPTSVKYSEYSIESYEPLIKDGTLDIEIVQAITPDNLDKYESRYNFIPSLVDGPGFGKEFTPTEKSGMCSHFEMLNAQASQDELFLIMEHDSYLLDPEIFKLCLEMSWMNKLDYTNLGKYFSCYTVSRRYALWAFHMLVKRQFPINCGAYLNMERLFKTFLSSDPLWQQHAYENKMTALLPVAKEDGEKLALVSKYKEVLSLFRSDIEISEKTKMVKTPSTQIFSKSLGATQDHRYNNIWDTKGYFIIE